MTQMHVAVAFLAGLLVLTPVAATATSVVHLEDETLVAISHVIVEGTVERVASAWNSNHTQIHTTVTIRVTRTLKGNPPRDEVVLKLLGGQVGDQVMEVVGGPTFKKDQDVIVFLDPAAPRLMPITGLYQGKFTVQRNPDTGQRMIQERGVPVSRFISKIANLVAEQEQGER